MFAIFAIVLFGSVPGAWSHTGFDPEEAAPSSVVALALNVSYERTDIGFTRVELYFPEGVAIPVVETAPVAGWTLTAVGDLSAPTQLVWEGGPATDDVQFPLTIGPLPADEGRLQFKILQTYEDGTIDRWIEEWPESTEEPDNPGPFLDLVVGGPGTVVEPTTVPTTEASQPTTTTAAATTSTASAEQPAESDAPDDTDDDSGSGAPVVVALVVAAAVGAGGAYFILRRRAGRAR